VRGAGVRADSTIIDRQERGVALALLSFTAGSMDAIAFLTLGHIFTSAMSGNTVLLGIALGQGRMAAAALSVAAFLGYVAGVAGAAVPLGAPSRGIERTLRAETLFLAAFAALWTLSGGPAPAPLAYALIVLSAIAMGMQGAVGRSVRIPGIPTVVFTSTLTAIVASLAERALARERPVMTVLTRWQFETFVVYLASAALTGFALIRAPAGVAFLPLASGLALVLGLWLRWLKL
jgi:uncharacterized membrane protein YoaK (UPF0700 family)